MVKKLFLSLLVMCSTLNTTQAGFMSYVSKVTNGAIVIGLTYNILKSALVTSVQHSDFMDKLVADSCHKVYDPELCEQGQLQYSLFSAKATKLLTEVSTKIYKSKKTVRFVIDNAGSSTDAAASLSCKNAHYIIFSKSYAETLENSLATLSPESVLASKSLQEGAENKYDSKREQAQKDLAEITFCVGHETVHIKQREEHPFLKNFDILHLLSDIVSLACYGAARKAGFGIITSLLCVLPVKYAKVKALVSLEKECDLQASQDLTILKAGVTFFQKAYEGDLLGGKASEKIKIIKILFEILSLHPCHSDRIKYLEDCINKLSK